MTRQQRGQLIHPHPTVNRSSSTRSLIRDLRWALIRGSHRGSQDPQIDRDSGDDWAGAWGVYYFPAGKSDYVLIFLLRSDRSSVNVKETPQKGDD
jgi:hypothetical protein